MKSFSIVFPFLFLPIKIFEFCSKANSDLKNLQPYFLLQVRFIADDPMVDQVGVSIGDDASINWRELDSDEINREGIHRSIEDSSFHHQNQARCGWEYS